MLKLFLHLIFPLLTGLSCLSAGDGIVNAKDYQNNSTLQFKWALESLDVFGFGEGDKVLDLGCGTGSVTQAIAAKVPSGIVIGLDISEMMLLYAREHYPAPNLIYMRGDARELPFVGQFDKATALLSLHWVHEQESALSSLYAALKPNGKALITLPGKQADNLGPVVEGLAKTDRWAPYFPHFKSKRRYYTADEYRPLLENAGFTIEKISQDSTYTPFKNRESLEGFFRPLCSFMDHLSPALQKQFVEEIVDVVLKFNTVLEDGSILLHDFKIEVIVSKPEVRILR